ncbi:MAG: Phytochelatin synthase-domain-containing protein, partial [Podila humilis]
MASNSTLMNAMVRSSSSISYRSRLLCLTRPRAYNFSTSKRTYKPLSSAPAASPAVSSPSAITTASRKPPSPLPVAAAAVVSSNNAALPFSYDPTGLSTQAVKKPSCDNLNLKNSFYRRKLPEHLVSFTSPKGKQLFRQMLESGYGEGYFSLVGNFTTQSEPAFCGPSSLAMVLNSLEVDPQRQWKGAWRWYSDELLECCAPADQVKAKGITFNQFACLSKCHCDVQVRRANQVSLEQFKKDLEMVCSRDDIHMVVSFSRKALGQTGDGHFSPIGGYVPSAGMVLVLDTARFKYPSYFVSVKELWKSLFPIDVETGSSRGYFLLSANPDQPAISLCKIPKSQLPEISKSKNSASNLQSAMSWTSLAQTFCKDLPSRIQSENPQTLDRMISVVLQGVPREYAFWISQQQAHRLRDTTELIDSIRSTKLYSLVSSAFPVPSPDPSLYPGASQKQREQLVRQQHEGALVFGTLFLMSSPSTLFLTLPNKVSKQFEQLRKVALESPEGEHRVLKEEVERMRSGIVDLVNSFCCCG